MIVVVVVGVVVVVVIVVVAAAAPKLAVSSDCKAVSTVIIYGYVVTNQLDSSLPLAKYVSFPICILSCIVMFKYPSLSIILPRNLNLLMTSNEL